MLNFPRIFGALVLIWGLRAVAEAIATRQAFWAGIAALWLVAGGYLVSLNRVRLASVAVLLLIGLEFAVRVPPLTGLALLAWIALIVAVTEGRPNDRALLLRTCVTIVYAFAALTKLNPSWLAGEGIAGLIILQPQLSVFRFVAGSAALATALAIVVLGLEGWLAIGLWLERTRIVTAGIGVLLHTALVGLVTPNVWATVHLTIFNFGLVACYPAFWKSIGRDDKRVDVTAARIDET